MPNPAQADFNADGSGDACTDADGDGALDESDCAPLVSGVSALPGEIGPTLSIEYAGGGTLTWKRGFQGHGTHVYRGSILVGQNPVPTMTCIEADIPGEQAIDPEIPPVGSAFAYLVRAVNVCGASGVGEYGPLGAPRADPPSSCSGANEDDDLDTIASLLDNCPTVPNADQSDVDGDFVGDSCDNCPTTSNPDQTDSDGNGSGDACAALLDADGDGIEDSLDNCIGAFNTTQLDVDGDGTGDACDACPDEPVKVDPGICGCSVPDEDRDADGAADCVDPCPDDPDNDLDGDGVCESTDFCPADPGKSAPGVCGCGIRRRGHRRRRHP